MACLAAGIVWFVLAAGPIAAHGPIHEQIEALSARIDRDPRNAGLYLRRGELWGADGKLEAALADFERAERLDPALAVVDMARGRAFFRAGRLVPARKALDRFLAGSDEHHPGASAMRARVLVQLGDFRGAAHDYERAIAGWERPKPEFYVERARAHAALGEREQALRGLDDGIAKLGPVVSLQLPAIELELACGRHEAALARVEAAAAGAPRREAWLARRGEILERAGRAADARRAYSGALAALTAARPTRATRELESRIHAALARLPVHADTEGEP